MKIWPVVMLVIGISGSGLHAETVRITNGEFAPFVSRNLKHFGVISHIVSEAFAAESLEVEYGFFPWQRSMDYAESGEWQGTLPWTITEERQRIFYFSQPIMSEEYVLLHHKDLPLVWDAIEDLSGLRIGATRGYFYGDNFESSEQQKKLKVRRVAKDKQNLLKLLYGRVDVIAIEKNVAAELMDALFTKEQQTEYVFNEKPLISRTLHLLLAKSLNENKVILDKFNRGLSKLKNSGKYDEFINSSLNQEYRLQ